VTLGAAPSSARARFSQRGGVLREAALRASDVPLPCTVWHDQLRVPAQARSGMHGAGSPEGPVDARQPSSAQKKQQPRWSASPKARGFIVAFTARMAPPHLLPTEQHKKTQAPPGLLCGLIARG